MTKKALGKFHTTPADVHKALASSAKAKLAWVNEITPLAKNEWICWITSAKQKETRERRLNRAIEELEKGKRRPCCWAGCSHR